MNIEKIKNALPEFAKDIKLNLSTVLQAGNSLSEKQIASIALASAYATKNKVVITAFYEHANDLLSQDEINATKGAAIIMAMNNIYYRFTHSIENKTYSNMPAKLRMNIMANPGMDKIQFELSSLAVSAINGCGKCMNAHTLQLEKAGISKDAIQSAVRIASVINAAALGLELWN